MRAGSGAQAAREDDAAAQPLPMRVSHPVLRRGDEPEGRRVDRAPQQLAERGHISSDTSERSFTTTRRDFTDSEARGAAPIAMLDSPLTAAP